MLGIDLFEVVLDVRLAFDLVARLASGLSLNVLKWFLMVLCSG